jgi:UDPglucose 6-dehydrogenase
MRIAVVGSGYVGLVVGTCFSDMGNTVYCIDNNEDRINQLKNGNSPIYEIGLEELIKKNSEGGRLKFTSDLSEGIMDAQFIFIAVGTPPKKDGSANLDNVIKVAQEIGRNINDYKIVINKSTVPVGTAYKVKEIIKKELAERNKDIEFDVVSNPEFLKEGDAVQDFMKPERVIIGTDSEKAEKMMKELYSVFFRQRPKVIFMDILSAEVTKYAANSILATKISFMNEMSNLCEAVGADIEKVRIGIGSDRRIGYSFIYPGTGYGGSCFPKDVKAIINTAKKNNYEMNILKAVETVNENQKKIVYKKIKKYFKSLNQDLKNKNIGIWGLAFKPGTDDMREAPSEVIIKALINDGAKIHAHDPKATDEAKNTFKEIINNITFHNNNYNALKNCDAFVLLTEWHIYRQPDFDKIKKLLKRPVIFDGRNLYNPEYVQKLGFEYFGIGRKK